MGEATEREGTMEDEMIGTKETMRLAKFSSPSTLRKKWRAGEFPRPIQPGDRGRLYWWRSEVMEWLESRRVPLDPAA